MAKFKKLTLNILILIFFIHGMLYYLTPNSSYSVSNPIKLIKYIVVALVIIVMYLQCKIGDTLKKGAIYCGSAIILFLIYMYSNNMSDIGGFLNYIIPFITVFVIKDLYTYIEWEKISVITYLTATVIGYINCYILKGVFPQWHVSAAYREVSIFVNPNNFGIMVSLFLMYFLIIKKKNHSKRNSVIWNVFLIINSFLLIRISGSNTALILYGIILLYFLGSLLKFVNFKKINYKKVAIYSIPVIIICGVIVVINSGMGLRKISLNSILIRFSSYKEFFGVGITGLIFPYRFGKVYVDNMYLSLWGSFGLIVLIIFVAYNIYVIKMAITSRKYNYLLVLMTFLLMGITTNFLYLWPLGYIYWGATVLMINDCKKSQEIKRQKRLYE